MSSDNSKLLTGIYILVSVCAIAVLVVLLSKNKQKSCSPYKNCSGSGNLCECRGQFSSQRTCYNDQQRNNSYTCDGLTEFADLAGMQKAAGGSQWSKFNFGDYSNH